MGIARHGGEVTKFLGDGVMAYFDAEDVDGALEARRHPGGADEIRGRFRTQRTAPAVQRFRPLARPGVEGIMGSSIKMDYTIIGEPVNTAAKLEALTRTLGRPVLMTSDVVDETHRPWDTDQLGDFDLGRDELMAVHALRTGADDGWKAEVRHTWPRGHGRRLAVAGTTDGQTSRSVWRRPPCITPVIRSASWRTVMSAIGSPSTITRSAVVSASSVPSIPVGSAA